jgi:hypothetical protein
VSVRSDIYCSACLDVNLRDLVFHSGSKVLTDLQKPENDAGSLASLVVLTLALLSAAPGDISVESSVESRGFSFPLFGVQDKTACSL